MLRVIDRSLDALTRDADPDFPDSSNIYDNLAVIQGKDDAENPANASELTPMEKAFFASKIAQQRIQTKQETDKSVWYAFIHWPGFTTNNMAGGRPQ